MSREKLKRLMTRHELTENDVAAMVHVSPSAVQSWLKPETSKSARPIPRMALELIELKTKARKR